MTDQMMKLILIYHMNHLILMLINLMYTLLKKEQNVKKLVLMYHLIHLMIHQIRQIIKLMNQVTKNQASRKSKKTPRKRK